MSDAARELVRNDATWFEPEPDDLAVVLEQIGDARLVLIGESTHGTRSSTACARRSRAR